MVITYHGQKRGKRLGLGKKATPKIAERALQYGIKFEDIKEGSFKKYLNQKNDNLIRANQIIIYNRAIYLFRNDILITILTLDQKYFKISDKYLKQKLVAIC